MHTQSLYRVACITEAPQITQAQLNAHNQPTPRTTSKEANTQPSRTNKRAHKQTSTQANTVCICVRVLGGCAADFRFCVPGCLPACLAVALDISAGLASGSLPACLPGSLAGWLAACLPDRLVGCLLPCKPGCTPGSLPAVICVNQAERFRSAPPHRPLNTQSTCYVYVFVCLEQHRAVKVWSVTSTPTS